MAVRQFVLTLDGTAQRLSDVLPDPAIASRDNVALRVISLQPGPSNANPVFIGDENVTTALWAWRSPAPTGGNPPAPLILGEFESGPIKLSNFYVRGTDGETLHIGTIPF